MLSRSMFPANSSTEDYYVANKLMKGFIGSGNIDTNSRLCMASSVAGHVRAFGEDVVPGNYEDWEQADLVVLVGSNTAWCHPVLFQRLTAARASRGTKIVAIDPRRTATCEAADLHLPLAPGTDVALFAGLLVNLADGGALDQAWIGEHTDGFDAALAAARQSAGTVAQVAAITELAPEAIAAFYELFAGTERVVTVYSQGVNQSSAGTDKVNAIINCHLATGRIGRPGMGPFSVTGQPNAMGGREVGGLANQLAAHMRFDVPKMSIACAASGARPNMATRPGLKAVDLFDAVLDGRIKAVWIAATNPAASMPRAERVRAALEACPFVVVSDCWPTDTTAFADVVLAGRGLGREGRHRHQFRAPHLAPARLPRSARRGQAGLVDVRGSGAPHGLGRVLSPMTALQRFSANTRRCRVLRTRAAAPSTLDCSRICPPRTITQCRPLSGRFPQAERATADASSRTAAFPRPIEKRTSSQRRLSPLRRKQAAANRLFSIPGAFAINGTP